MNRIAKVKLLLDRMTGLLEAASGLKDENLKLSGENTLLKEEVEILKEQLRQSEASAATYIAERDNIKERVERLIGLIN